MVEAKKQLQREVDLEDELPPRGTGRETGRARPNLTDEERAQRHAFIDECLKQGKSEEECVAEWEKEHGK
jgi:hypothetical protein